jgi:hypothetical protein
VTDLNVAWLLIRGSGLVAFALLAASSVWGLLLSGNVLGRTVGAKALTWIHEALAIGAVLATGLHLAFLVGDNYFHYGLRELLLPGASTYRPLAVAWGVVAFYALFVVTASFYVRPLIGHNLWRAIHFLSFGTFLAAAAHGITAGADTTNPAVLALYATTITSVVLLVGLRVASEAPSEAPAPRRPTPAQTVPPRS